MRKQPDFLLLIIIALAAAAAVFGMYCFSEYRADAYIDAQNAHYRALRSEPLPTQTAAPADLPLPTPDADTVRIGLPTMPPADARFDRLVEVNPEFCGWLTAGSDIDLPVVHREFDNQTYLSVDFDRNESVAGTLFMDGWNRVWPADTLTLIYGHNMNNGSMFGHLHRYERTDYLLAHPIITFETLYESAQYVPFAAFYAKAGDVEIRQLQPNVEEFNALMDEARARSVYKNGIDVRYGDKLLVLLTCASGAEDNRFFLLCRQLRENESTLGMRMTLQELLKP